VRPHWSPIDPARTVVEASLLMSLSGLDAPMEVGTDAAMITVRVTPAKTALDESPTLVAAKSFGSKSNEAQLGIVSRDHLAIFQAQ
jgi:hypothetical protein